jgi:hypothetical protein
VTGTFYGYSWWAVAAVALNWPWINLVAWGIFEVHHRKQPDGDSYFYLAALAWLIAIHLQFVCWGATMSNTANFPGLVRGRGLAWLGVGIACMAPVFRFVYFAIF